ncbi:MAG: D-tyrosyl-tRNA(Tyr) deacylase [Victivallales bacterium]|nr:D-tyrosyl-tRNA(Tyr) deacylase [Victivallales bacterium]
MRVLLQRVSQASVVIDGEVVGTIGKGVLLLVGITHDDTRKEADFLVEKAANLRVFDDEDGVMNCSLLDVGGEALVVSQFTLYGDARKGRRPSYVAAAPGAVSEPLYEYFVQKMRELGVTVATGRFGADMKVSLVNDGPVTLWLEKNA